MRDDAPTEEIIRQYLLGRLDDQHDRERLLSEQTFLDDELSEKVDSIEEEIIEDYLDGAISVADRIAVEEYFLRPPERKQKLQFARTLRGHFATASAVATKNKAGVPSKPVGTAGASGFHVLPRKDRSYYRIYFEIAAAVLIIVPLLIYATAVRHRLESQLDVARREQAQMQGELERERKHSTDMEARLQAVPPVNLAFPRGQFRGAPKTVEIKSWTQRIRVEIELPKKSSANYDVHLELKTGQIIWSQTGLAAASGELRFDIPATAVASGEYCIVVDSISDQYCFQARLTK